MNETETERTLKTLTERLNNLISRVAYLEARLHRDDVISNWATQFYGSLAQQEGKTHEGKH